MKTVNDYHVTYHGIDGEQYFQGHGTSFTTWTDCATGIGDSNLEAIEDALESLAEGEWDVSTIKDGLRRDGAFPSDKPDDLGDEMHYYVSIDVK